MLRGLVFRQAFFALDVVLALIVAWTAFLVVTRWFGGPSVADSEIGLSLDAQAPEVAFYTVRPREEYQPIIDSGIFGPAARLNRDTQPEQPVAAAVPVEEETQLPLRLTGTVISGRNQKIATALIENMQGGRAGATYYLNEEITDGVFLLEVRPDEVLLDNKNTGKREVLKRDRDILRVGTPGAVVASQAEAEPARSSSNVIQLDRTEMSQELIENYEEIATTLDIREYVDENGEVAGLTAPNVEDVAIAQKLGLQNDDVLTSINNEPINSVDKVYEVLEKYRNASTFRLGILRGGRPQYVTYRLR